MINDKQGVTMEKFEFRFKVSGDEGTGDQVDQKDIKPDDGTQDDPSKGEQKGDNDKLDLSALPESAQKLIKDLRAENAKRRTDFNNMSTKMENFEKGMKSMFGEEDSDDADPVTKLEAMSGQYQQLSTKNAILEIALENNISGKDNYEYFEFLMSKALNSLEEGEEMTEEHLTDILSKINASANGKKGNTSTGDNGQGKAPDKKDGEISQVAFNKMSITEKSVLYQKSPELYNKLMKGINL